MKKTSLLGIVSLLLGTSSALAAPSAIQCLMIESQSAFRPFTVKMKNSDGYPLQITNEPLAPTSPNAQVENYNTILAGKYLISLDPQSLGGLQVQVRTTKDEKILFRGEITAPSSMSLSNGDAVLVFNCKLED